MVLNAVVRVLVNRAVNAAFWFASRFRRAPLDQPPTPGQDAAHPQTGAPDLQSRETMKRARQAARLLRRLGR